MESSHEENISRPMQRTNIKFGVWEDEKLKEIVERIGTGDWKEVSRLMGNRTPRQCRERYRTYLAPGIILGPWTVEEDDMVIKMVKMHGKKWATVAKMLPGRSDNQIKNRWNTHLKKTIKGRVFYGRKHVPKEKEQKMVEDDCNDEIHLLEDLPDISGIDDQSFEFGLDGDFGFL